MAKCPSASMKPANQGLSSKFPVSNGIFTRSALRQWFKLSIALCKALNLGVRNLPFTNLISIITASALLIVYLQTLVFLYISPQYVIFALAYYIMRFHYDGM